MEEPFDAAVAFRLADEAWRGVHTQKADLILEVLAHVLCAVVMTQDEAGGDLGAESAEVLAHALTDGFEGLEARGPFDGVDADAVGRAVVDGGEDGHFAFFERYGH